MRDIEKPIQVDELIAYGRFGDGFTFCLSDMSTYLHGAMCVLKFPVAASFLFPKI